MFHIQTLFKRLVAFSLATAALGAALIGPPAHALSCESPQPAKVSVPALFAQAQWVVIGRVTHKGAAAQETWSSRSLATISVEKVFRGGKARSFEVFVRSDLPVGARVLVFAFPSSSESAQPLNADGLCFPTAFVMGSAEAQEYLSAIEALPQPGQGGQLLLKLRAVPVGTLAQYLDAHLSEAGPQAKAPGHAAGKPPFELEIKGPNAQRRLFGQWLPRKGDEEVSVLIDHLPAGRHEIALLICQAIRSKMMTTRSPSVAPSPSWTAA